MSSLDHTLAYRITYSIPRAARLLRVTPQLVHSWVTPHVKIVKGERRLIEPLCAPSVPVRDGHIFLSFFDVAELNMACTMIFDRNIKRKKAEALIRGWRKLRADTPHYLINKKFIIGTAGNGLFVDVIKEGVTVDVSDQQCIMRDIIAPEALRFSYMLDDDLPYQWTPKEGGNCIIISPSISRGKPVVSEKYIPTEALSITAQVDGIESAANQYGVSPDAVRRAVEFEKSLDSKRREAA